MPLIPSDARLLQAGLPPLEQDWSERANKRAALEAEVRNRDAMARANAAEAAQREQALADLELIKRTAAETGDGAPDKVLARLRQVSPTAAIKYQADWQDARKKEFEAGKSEHELEAIALKQNLGLVELAKARPELWPAIRQQIVKNDPDMEPIVPQDFDAGAIEHVWKLGLDAEKLHGQEAKSLEYLVNGKWHQAAAMAFSTATDAADADRIAGGLIRQGVPRDVVESFGPYSPTFAADALKRGTTPDQQVTNARQERQDAATLANQQFDNATARAQLDVSRGHLGVAQAGLALRRQELAQGGKESGREDLVEAVLANPGLYDQITPTERGKIAGELQRRGFTGFGRPLSEGAAKQIANTDAAIQSLGDLREILKKNEQYIGPVAGLSALNPYSDARKAQADIDRVRQRSGKALEGGVLREHDEKKYKEMLATLRDTPELAIYKTDQLIKDLERDKTTFIHQQRLTGRRVPQGETPAGGAQTSGTPTAKRQAQVGDIVKHPNGKRYRVVSISGGAADLEPID